MFQSSFSQAITEALSAYSLLEASEASFRKKTWEKDAVCFLLSRKWFIAWTEYTGYFDVSRGCEITSEQFAQCRPSSRINEDLIAANPSLSSFAFDETKLPVESAQLNTYIHSTCDANSFKIIDQPTWEFFSALYPEAIPIPRPVAIAHGRVYPNAFLLQPDVIVITQEVIANIRDKRIGKQPLETRKCQLSPFATAADLQQLFSRHFSTDNLRVFRYDQSVKREDITIQISKAITSSSPIVLRAAPLHPTSTYLGNILKNHYTIIIEVSPLIHPLTCVRSLETFGKLQGVCEGCAKNSLLQIRCLCKQVVYCSSSCKYKDQDFHSRTCDLAADSESDEEMEFLPIEVSGRAGLTNIGNTCYLAAAVQALYATKEYAEEFTMNNVEKKQTMASTPTIKLLPKFAKLLKEIAMQNDEPLQPWSFKTQLAKLYDIFSGNYQHDAGEFLTCLLDAINDQCAIPAVDSNQDEGEDPSKYFWNNIVKSQYSKPLLNSFAGLFESTLRCFDCENTSTSYDAFTMLSLPIKAKPVERQILINFIRHDLSRDIEQIRASYTTGTTTIAQLIKTVCQKIDGVDCCSSNIVVCTTDSDNFSKVYSKDSMLNGLAEDLESSLEGKNKSLVFFELPSNSSTAASSERNIIDTSTFDALHHRCIPIYFSRIAKITMGGMMQVDEKQYFASPLVMLTDKSSSLASIYLEISSRLTHLHPEAVSLVKSAFEKAEEAKDKYTKQKEIAEQEKQKIIEKRIKLEQEKKAKDTAAEEKQNAQKDTQTSTATSLKPSTSKALASSGGGWDDFPVISTSSKQLKKQLVIPTNKNSAVPPTSATKISPQPPVVTVVQPVPAPAPTPSTVTPQVDSSDWGWDIPVVTSKQAATKVQTAATQKPVVTNLSSKQAIVEPKKEVEAAANPFTTVNQKKNLRKPNNQYATVPATATPSQTQQPQSSSNVRGGQQPPVVTQNDKTRPLPSTSSSVQTQQPAVISQTIDTTKPPTQAVEKLYATAFQEIEKELKESESTIMSELLVQMPFQIIVRTKKRRVNGVFKCYFCEKSNCQGCALPFSSSLSLLTFINTYRETFSLEIFWSKSQPNKSLFSRVFLDQSSAVQQAKKLNLPSLQYCLEEFQSAEVLSADNAWLCWKCQQNKQAEKLLKIKFAPNNLIIQIKRFTIDPIDGSRSKNSTQVLFPETSLQLPSSLQAPSPFVVQEDTTGVTYDLYAVIQHEGTADQGHYIAHCKHGESQQWLCFDDEKVSRIDSEKVINNKNAYILFYRIKQSHPNGKR